MQGERTREDVNSQGNAGECQRNVLYWVQSARGMQGNAKETYGSECKVPGECR